eukprot:9027584-Heterocapsa_arctica.AAC.1
MFSCVLRIIGGDCQLPYCFIRCTIGSWPAGSPGSPAQYLLSAKAGPAQGLPGITFCSGAGLVTRSDA